MVERLLKKGCDPNCRTLNSSSPAIIEAVMCADKRYLQLLLQYGANVEARDSKGMTAVLHASDRGLIEHLQILADNEADMKAVDHAGASALMLAAQWDCFECIDRLLKYSHDINGRDNENMTALMYAAKQGSKDSLHLLIESGADLNVADCVKGFTALMYALEHRHSECASILLDSNAQINIIARGKEAGTTALTLAFRISKDTGEFSFIEKLLQLGSDVTLSETDQSYLHEMVAREKRNIVRLMVMNGCPPFDRRCWEHFFKFSEHKIPISPLCVALLSGFYDIAKYFVVNKFYTKYDIVTLPNDPDIRQKLQEKGEKSLEALAILDLICSKPQSLRVVSFVAISEVFYRVARGTGRCRNIRESRLPEQLQEELLFKKWTSLCVSCWHEVSIEEDQMTEKCSCSQCGQEGLRVRVRRTLTS